MIRQLLLRIARMFTVRCPRCKEPLVVKRIVLGKYHPSHRVLKCNSCGLYHLDYKAGLRVLTSDDPLAETHWIVYGTEYKPHPYCHECGYNLTENVTGICSECGTPIIDERQQLA